MTIDALKANILQERKILEDILVVNEELRNAKNEEEKNFFSTALDSLLSQAKIINDSLPTIIASISLPKLEFTPLPKQNVLKPIQTSTGVIMLKKEEKAKFMQELMVEKDVMNKLKKMRVQKVEAKEQDYKQVGAFTVISSRLFSNAAYSLADSSLFKKLKEDLRKANMYYLPSTYIAMALFSMLIVFVLTFVFGIFNALFSIVTSGTIPTLQMVPAAEIPLKLLKNIGLSFLLPFIVIGGFMMYPSSQASSISKKIQNELPFTTIYMSSIAGSGVEPRKIFSILATSQEYPAIGGEMKKVINQVNLYGYDLVTALKNIAKSTSSEKFGGLLNGIATNIVSGGDLRAYLDKRAADTLLEYKLERKKYSSMAETAMDMYIGIAIATPMIFMVLLIVMNATGMGFGLDMTTLSFMIIGGIAALNVGFLVFLQIRQPN
jgi:flagellar protein FlaJ